MGALVKVASFRAVVAGILLSMISVLVAASIAPVAAAPATVAEVQAAASGAVASASPRTADSRLRRPSRGGVLSGFGMRVHPYTHVYKLHTGIDFSAGDGRARAAMRGRVVSAGWKGAYGNTVVVDHGRLRGQRIQTLYAHLAGFRVHRGQRIGKGAVIGIIGSTGHSTWRHLHFEVRVNGRPVNPRNWLAI